MQGNPIIVQPVPQAAGARRWQPAAGAEMLDFLQHSVPEQARASVSEAASSILGKGIPPDAEGQETGLVVGYVQSGKTMSFEAVTALAHDNGFQIAIVITGTSNPLFNQSTGRVRGDLQLDAQRVRRWMHFKNPNAVDAVLQPMRDALEEWRDLGIPQDSKRTILITVLKQHIRIRNLTNLLNRLNLATVPVLIVDDEADQASLNTQVAQNQQSTTYARLMALRQAIPNHTYLQYTATPQAPLLINIIDSLSPNFLQVLDPGEDYVGGRAFFVDNPRHARLIPANEVPTNNNPLAEPPASLIEALGVFMIGVAAGLHEADTGNRSMFVSPSHRTIQHQEFYGWVRDIVDEWKRRLALPDGDLDKQELLEDLRRAHVDLANTVANIPAFEVLAPRLSQAFRNTRVQEVNARAGQTPQIDWRSAYGWILVGGQAMDRGFTVEGLTVTYMPRGVGVGNVDTVQQRGRFFGYKRRYFGYCRVYLEQGTLDAFQRYVDHEEDIRVQLQDFQRTGRSLNEWKRAFVLDTRYSPCRNSVVQFDYMQRAFGDEWVNPSVVLASEAVANANRQTATDFIADLQWTDDEGNANRTDVQRHHICRDIQLRRVVENLLLRMRVTGTTDTQLNLGLLLQLARALENNPEEICTIYRMSPARDRERGVDDSGEITNLYQGEAPVFPVDRRGSVYPGDRALRDPGNVTVQIHILNLTRDGNVIAQHVPVLAVWVPGRLRRGWLAQAPQR